MKKLYTEQKWKKYSRARQAKELARRVQRRRYLKTKRRSSIGLSPQERWKKIVHARHVQVKAPSDFSCISNPEQFCRFLKKIREVTSKKHNVFIDLNDIRSFTPDAITILLSKMADHHFMSNMMAAGNAPADESIAKVLAQSGFYDYVQSREKPSGKGYSLLHTKESRQVEGQKALELINFATEKVFGNRRQMRGIYRVLIEAMLNTHGHASRESGKQETWWAMVYFDPDMKKASFSFVDNGIGIFESIRIKFANKIALFARLKNNGDLLKELLQGQIGSRTGSPRRGKGIPAMYAALKRGQIRNFIIVANDVYGKIDTDEYRILDTPFNGTFLYWEICNA